MNKIITGGWLDGRLVRRARKAHDCVNGNLHRRGGVPDCLGEIMAGAYYAEVEVDPDHAGGFGMKKACMACAGPEARSLVYAAGVWEQGK